jgi:hypothetical protein
MATVTADQAASTFPVFEPSGRGIKCFAYGSYTISSALSKNDLIEFCKVNPCFVVGGFLAAADLDTGTEAMEVDVGDGSDADEFLDSGVLTGDAISGSVDVFQSYGATTYNFRWFNGILVNGPSTLTGTPTTITGTVVAAANAGGTGLIWTGVDFVKY